MTNLLTKFDLMLIDTVFQPVTDAIEAKTGINNFFVTRMILSLTSAYAIVCFVNMGNLVGALISGFVGLIYVLFSIQVESSSKKRFINAFRSSPFPWFMIRIGILISILNAILELSTSISLLGFLGKGKGLEPVDNLITAIGLSVALYTLACTPLPPGFKKSKKVLAHAAH